MHKTDSFILKSCCEAAIDNGSMQIDPKEIFFENGKPIIPEQELRDALEIMDRYGSIELNRTIGFDLDEFSITDAGFELYARECIPNYQDKIKSVMLSLVNKGLLSNSLIAQELDEPLILVDHILDILEQRGDIQQSKSIGGPRQVVNVSPAVRRALNKQV